MAKKAKFADYVKNTNEYRKKRSEVIDNSEYEHLNVFDVPDDIQDALLKQKKKKKKDGASEKNKELVKKAPQQPQNIRPVTKNPYIVDTNDIKKKIYNLEGIQKGLFYGLLQIAYSKKQLTLEQLTHDQLVDMAQGSYGSTKTSLVRLIKKGLILRYKGKTSPKGYYNLGFEPTVYELSINSAKNYGVQEILQEEVEA